MRIRCLVVATKKEINLLKMYQNLIGKFQNYVDHNQHFKISTWGSRNTNGPKKLKIDERGILAYDTYFNRINREE
jgi:hypothetical protein